VSAEHFSPEEIIGKAQSVGINAYENERCGLRNDSFSRK
jgi:hypothetical protein